MTEKLQQTIKEEMVELPKEMQEVINSFDWIKITEEIAEKYSLDEDELNDFQLETLLLLIGSTDPEFYAINIENQVETTKEEAENIAKESFQKIFNPLNKLITENVKKNIQNKKLDWKQTLDFIVSGGDYSVFMEKRNEKESDMINTTPYNPLVRGDTTSPHLDKGEVGRGF